MTVLDVALRSAALFLDLDGTLTPIVARPELVGPDPRRTALLSRLAHALEGRLAIVSGRGIEDLDRILEGAAPALAGLHGLERRRADGVIDRVAAPSELALVAEEARALCTRAPALQVEDKGLSIALHYRAAPDRAGDALAFARRIAAQTGLFVQEGKMVVEIRAGGSDKGSAVRSFMGEQPFAGATPIFVGDDLTDEAGFAAASSLNGFGVLVGDARRSQAMARIAGPGAVLSWIERSIERKSFVLEVECRGD